MIICLLNRFIPLIQLRYVLSVKIYILPTFGTLYLDLSGSQRGLGLRGSGLKIAGLRGSGAPGFRTTINRAPGLPRNWSEGSRFRPDYWKCTGYLLSSFRFPANSKQSTLWRYCVQECPNFNIWGFGLRSKRFEGSRLYSKIILGLSGSAHPLSPSLPPWDPNLLIGCYENQTVFPSMIDGCRLLLIP